jgi:hypothetical protein
MPEIANNQIDLDEALNAFLSSVRSGQSLDLADWAARVQKRGTIAMQDLERCFALGFAG